MNLNPAPIVVFAYDRPDHLSQTLASLAGNDLAGESVLFVFCDGARQWGGDHPIQCKADNYIAKRYGAMLCSREDYDLYLHRIAITRKIAHDQKGFREVHVIEREHNIGLADNIVGAVTEIVNQFGRVIAFEDDIITTKGCLTYLNDALELYKNDPQVMHISAWMYPHKKKFPETFFYDSPYPAGGWATWKRAWEKFNPDTEDHVAFWKDKWKDFDIEGENHLSRQLLMNLDGRLKTWYIKWYSSIRRAGGLCLYPGIAMSNNIGWDGSGETSTNESRYFVESPAEYTKVERIPIQRNNRAYRYIRIWYSGHWYSKRYRRKWMSCIKHFLGIR